MGNGNNPPSFSNCFTMNCRLARCAGLTNGLSDCVGSMVRRLLSAKAHRLVGRYTVLPPGGLMHGTTELPPSAARAAMMGCSDAVGAKMLLCVSNGTESCAS